MEDAIERLAEHVVNTNLSDIPNKAIQSAKTYIVDTIGVGLAGSAGPYVKELLNTYSLPSLPQVTSRVLGQNVKLNPADAALINGFQIHNSEFDCVQISESAHCMPGFLIRVFALFGLNPCCTEER